MNVLAGGEASVGTHSVLDHRESSFMDQIFWKTSFICSAAAEGAKIAHYFLKLPDNNQKFSFAAC